jgi:hypothetical protein
MAMEDLQSRIRRLRERIAADTNELIRLEGEWQRYLEQWRERSRYLSSQEIIAVIARYSGRPCSMATIKRWADEGYLGEVVDERERFPGLVRKQGNRRNLYPKTAVYPFLLAKGLIHPRYEILDRVRVNRHGANLSGVIVDIVCQTGPFLYTVQLDGSRETIAVPEEEIHLL